MQCAEVSLPFKEVGLSKQHSMHAMSQGAEACETRTADAAAAHRAYDGAGSLQHEAPRACPQYGT